MATLTWWRAVSSASAANTIAAGLWHTNDEGPGAGVGLPLPAAEAGDGESKLACTQNSMLCLKGACGRRMCTDTTIESCTGGSRRVVGV